MIVKLELPELQEVEINADDSALVIVDMENEFLSEGGKSYMAERGLRAIEQTAILLEKFRSHNSKVIYIQSIRSKEANMFKVFHQEQRLLENTWAVEIVDQLKPLPHEKIVQKRSNDCFNNTILESVLEELDLKPGRSQIVITGVATNVCVDCAAVGFSVRDYHVYVAVDATASFSEVGEMLGFNHYFGAGYTYNVTATSADMIKLEQYASTKTAV